MTMILRLALTSLRSRLLTTSLTVASIALSVTLLVGIENVRAGPLRLPPGLFTLPAFSAAANSSMPRL